MRTECERNGRRQAKTWEMVSSQRERLDEALGVEKWWNWSCTVLGSEHLHGEEEVVREKRYSPDGGGTAGERNEEPNGEGRSLGSRGTRPQNGKLVCYAWGWLGEELLLGCFVVIRPWGPGAGFTVAKTGESWTVDQHFPKKNEN